MVLYHIYGIPFSNFDLTKFEKYAIITFYKKIRLRLIAKPKDLITIKSIGFALSEACLPRKVFGTFREQASQYKSLGRYFSTFLMTW
jgi:hypothetical protein